MQRVTFAAGAASFAIVFVASVASGQEAQITDPKFEYAKPGERATDVVWKASAQAGAILATGNSSATTVSAGAEVSRRLGRNRFRAEANGSLARSVVLQAVDLNGDGVIGTSAAMETDEIVSVSQLTAQSWAIKGRYDRFFTRRNSLLLVATVGGDRRAGKDVVGGAQLGYARILHHSDATELSSEVGYDFTYEERSVGRSVSIHSLRAFLGVETKLTPQTSAAASIESLFNLNPLSMAPQDIAPFEDARVNGKLVLSTKLWENVAFRFAFEARYDNAPAPRPPLAIPYAEDFVFLATELDTRTEASLVITLL